MSNAIQFTTATLFNYHTGEELRPATAEELEASENAGPEGVIIVDGVSCYVVE